MTACRGVPPEVSKNLAPLSPRRQAGFPARGLGFRKHALHTIEAELASGALIEITSDHAPPGGHVIDMVAIYRTDSPPGPAGRWFIDRLKQAQAPPLKRELSPPQPVSVAAKVAGRRPSIR